MRGEGGALRYAEPNAIGNAIVTPSFSAGSHDAVIRVYDEAGNVMETHEQAVASSGDFGSIADLMRTRLQNGWEECCYTKICPAHWNTIKISDIFFQFDYYAAIDEERFAMPTSRPYHVLCHRHSRLS